MRQITKYIAKDDTEFNTEVDCLRYESILLSLENAMAELPLISRLSNEEFKKHPKGSVMRTRNKVIDIIAEALNIDKEVAEGAKKALHNQTIFGRWVNDSGNLIANETWFRFMSMDPMTDIEYSQPYYALKGL